MLLAAFLFLALTRAELLERFNAAPVIKVNGLVQVQGDCAPDIRREYQMPVAGFAADLCRSLYKAECLKEEKFDEPGLVILLGEERTNVTAVVARTKERADGSTFTRLYLPSPGYADVAAFRRETAKAFYRAVKHVELDDAAATKALHAADPALRRADDYASLAAWHAGEKVEGDDEHFLQLERSVLEPGVARPADILHFASRLFLYPEVYSSPFCGTYDKCAFRDAIALAKKDVRLRFLAYAKAPQLIAFGGGHGEKLSEAALAYSEFLRALAAYRKTEAELTDLLDAADAKLNLAMEEARLRAEGKIQ